jgi:Cys-rich repeat protein
MMAVAQVDGGPADGGPTDAAVTTDTVDGGDAVDGGGADASEPVYCNDDSDCPAGMVCQDEGTCRSGPASGNECTSGQDCQGKIDVPPWQEPGAVCIDGHCVSFCETFHGFYCDPPPGGCYDDSECTDGARCVDYYCQGGSDGGTDGGTSGGGDDGGSDGGDGNGNGTRNVDRVSSGGCSIAVRPPEGAAPAVGLMVLGALLIAARWRGASYFGVTGR